jgi:hypothetical protein
VNSVVCLTGFSKHAEVDVRGGTNERKIAREYINTQPARLIRRNHRTKASWPRFDSVDALKQDVSWYGYLHSVYGSSVNDPNSFPIDVSTFLVLQCDLMNSFGLQSFVAGLPACPGAFGDAYTTFLGTPPGVVWIFQPASPGFPDNSRVEVTHIVQPSTQASWEADGFWMYHARGSGIFYNVGKTKRYWKHQELVHDFLLPDHACVGEHQVDECVHVALAAAKLSGLDSVQFIQHADQACGPNIVPLEIVDLHQTGNSGCAIQVDKGLGQVREQCNCDSTQPFLNCQFGFQDNTTKQLGLLTTREVVDAIG